MLNKAAFIDRDGVINEEREYVHRISDFVLLPGAITGLLKLKQADYKLIVVTNQSGIGRNLYSERDFQILTLHMKNMLRHNGVQLDGVYYCPHHPIHGVGEYKATCACRKPLPGMLLQAAVEHNINLSRSVLIGDKLTDIQAGQAAGVKASILVRTGHNLSESDIDNADACVLNLKLAAEWILEHY